MIDRFMLDCGLLTSDDELPEGSGDLLVDKAEAFLRSGLFDFQYWCTLDSESQAAFIAANDRIWRERCAMIGFASQSRLNALAIEDPEAAKDEIASNALDQFSEKMKKK